MRAAARRERSAGDVGRRRRAARPGWRTGGRAAAGGPRRARSPCPKVARLAATVSSATRGDLVAHLDTEPLPRSRARAGRRGRAHRAPSRSGRGRGALAARSRQPVICSARRAVLLVRPGRQGGLLPQLATSRRCSGAGRAARRSRRPARRPPPSIARERVENSSISSSGTPAMSQPRHHRMRAGRVRSRRRRAGR